MIEQKFTYASEALIKFPNRSITDIANELGYFDSAYFSRQVEYSEDNMEALMSLSFDDVFETDNLCKLLWIDSTAL